MMISSDGFGGAEMVFVELANAISKNHTVSVVIPKRATYQNLLTGNVLCHTHKYKSRLNPLLWLELYHIFKAIKPDLVHTHSAKATELFSKLNIILKLPFVATKHNSRKGKIFEGLKNVVAVSDTVAKSINNKTDVIVIPNGIIPQNIQPCGSSNFITIGAVGRLDPIKGFDDLILSMINLPTTCKLLIAGEGSQREYLESIIEQNNLTQRVRLIGFCNDIPTFISQCDMLVVSSHSEGFSRVLLEGVWYAPIIVTTKVGGSEIFPDIFIIKERQFAKELNDIVENYEKLHQIFRSWADSVKDNYTIESVVNAHEQLYCRLVQC